MPIRDSIRRRIRGADSALDRVRDPVEGGVGRLYLWLARNRVTKLPWAVVQTYSRAEGALLSGSVAYYTFLSLLPLLLVAGSVLGTIARGRFDLQLVLASGITRLLPGVGATDLLGQLIRSRVTFGVVGLFSVVYAGSGFVGSVTACLNRMWRVEAGRNPIGQKIVNLLVVVLLGLVLLGSIGVTIWVRVATERVFGQETGWLVWLADRVAGPAMILLLLVLLYRLLPARKLSWRWQLPGALFGTIVVELLKRGFDLWARNSAGVSALPRSLLSVVLLLVWMGLFGQAILYGAAVNVVLHRRRCGEPIFPPGSLPEASTGHFPDGTGPDGHAPGAGADGASPNGAGKPRTGDGDHPDLDPDPEPRPERGQPDRTG